MPTIDDDDDAAREADIHHLNSEVIINGKKYEHLQLGKERGKKLQQTNGQEYRKKSYYT